MSTCCSTRRASASRAAPASVSDTFRLVRFSRLTSSSSSSLRTCSLTAGCATCSRLKCSSSATATKYLSWRSSILIAPVSPGPHRLLADVAPRLPSAAVTHRVPVQESGDQTCDLVAVGSGREVAGFEEVQLGVGHIVEVRAGALGREELVVPTPRKQYGRLVDADVLLPAGIQLDVALVVVEQVENRTWSTAGKLEVALIELPQVRVDGSSRRRLRQGTASAWLRAAGTRGQLPRSRAGPASRA